MQSLDDQTHVRFMYRTHSYRVPLSFIFDHPGGKSLLLSYMNKDITAAFAAAGHTDKAEELLEHWLDSAPEDYKQKHSDGNRRVWRRMQTLRQTSFGSVDGDDNNNNNNNNNISGSDSGGEDEYGGWLNPAKWRAVAVAFAICTSVLAIIV